MKVNEIPQDESKTYAGYRKVMYATENGRYTTRPSSGWEDEEFVTKQAVTALEEATEAALAEVRLGNKSPLYFYMYHYRHDLVSLAQTTGLFKWQITRHFDPRRFAKLPEKTLIRYAEAFNLSLDDLKQHPDGLF